MELLDADYSYMSSDPERPLPSGADHHVSSGSSPRTSGDGSTGTTPMRTPAASTTPSTSPGRHLVPRQLAESVLSELSHVLWQQRDLVTQLIYRLEVQQLVLAWGRTRWINISTEDVEAAIEDVRHQEGVRAALVEDLAPLLGTPVDASLRDLVIAAPEPWHTILGEHHTEFLKLSNEAEDAARSNADLLNHGLSDVRSLLQSFGSQPEPEYGSRVGSRNNGNKPAPASAVLVDREA